jgi:hypothetical protein
LLFIFPGKYGKYGKYEVRVWEISYPYVQYRAGYLGVLVQIKRIRIIERKIWEIGPQNVYFPAISREIDISQVCYLRSISREMLFPGKCGK